MTLSKRITEYILKRTGTTLTQLEGVVVSKGFTLDELYEAMELIHRDKQIRRTVKGGDIVYFKAPEPKTPVDHTKWVTDNYPRPGENGIPKFVMPFPEIDYDWIFLKTKQARDEYKALASGKPLYLSQTTRNHVTDTRR